MIKIRIKKIGIPENPVAPTPDYHTYGIDKPNLGVSVPLEYEIEGYMNKPIEEGYPVFVQRTKRNGADSPGHFGTTTVQSLTDKGFTTRNSVYEYEYLQNEQKFCKDCACGH
jgi:hypothetical protein